MTRVWSLAAAGAAALLFLVFFVVTLVVQYVGISLPHLYDVPSEPKRMVLRAILFFRPVSTYSWQPEMPIWDWIPRIAVLVFMAVMTYHTARAVAAGWLRLTLLIAGAVVLACGLGNAVGITIELIHAEANSGNLSIETARYLIDSSWSSNAIFVGIVIAPLILLQFGFMWKSRAWLRDDLPNIVEASTPLVEPRPLSGDAGRLATWGTIPLLVLAFLGGSLPNYVGDEAISTARLNPFEHLVSVTLYPKLRPTPPSDPSPFKDTVDLVMWLPQSIFALLFLVVGWALLRWIAKGFPPSGEHGVLAVALSTWSTVTIASLLIGAVNATMVDWLPSISSGAVVREPLDVLTRSIRFGALYGWLAGLSVVAARRWASNAKELSTAGV